MDPSQGIKFEVRGFRDSSPEAPFGRHILKYTSNLGSIRYDALQAEAQRVAGELNKAQISAGFTQKPGHVFGGEYGKYDKPGLPSEDLWPKSVSRVRRVDTSSANKDFAQQITIKNEKTVSDHSGAQYNLIGLLTRGTSGGQTITAHNGKGILSIYDRRGQRGGSHFPWMGHDGQPATVTRGATRGEDFVTTVFRNEHARVKANLNKVAVESAQKIIRDQMTGG